MEQSAKLLLTDWHRKAAWRSIEAYGGVFGRIHRPGSSSGGRQRLRHVSGGQAGPRRRNKPILERIVDQLRTLAGERLALVHDADLPPIEGLELVVESRAYAGPVAALANGLPAATGDVCLLVAGDMPFVSRAVFGEMLRIQAAESAAVVVPHVDGHIESMHAVFERRPLFHAIELAERTGEQRLFKIFESLNARLVGEQELRAIDPELHTLLNVNSAEDLDRANQIAGG